ncbi:MAG: alanine racemase [Neomegalonema sp.]|nr:alanine racemase [Neomegalonema sp.]
MTNRLLAELDGPLQEATLWIDLAAMAENWRRLDAMTPAQVATGAAVKANAYGTGTSMAMPAIWEAGCEIFFVATAQEALHARHVMGPDPAIYVLNGPRSGLAQIRLAEAQPVISCAADLALMRAAGDTGPCALQFETGMNRLGLTEAETQALLAAPEGLSPTLLMSHLASADEPSSKQPEAQAALFAALAPRLKAAFPGARLSLSATGGILRSRGFDYDLTRPGIGLYGGLPFEGALPVVHLAVPILRVWELAPGEVSGYGATWRAQRPSLLATIAAGYADGLPRNLSNKGRARVNGQIVPIAGRVSMDLITLDVTDLPSPPKPGDAAWLLDEELTVDRMAAEAGTIGYEILTSLGERYARLYRG